MYTSAKNAAFFNRLKSCAIAGRNFLDEIERLGNWFDTEVSPSNTDDAAFVDSAFATKNDAKLLLGYLRALKKIHDGQLPDTNGQTVSHDGILVPFLSDSSVLNR